MARLWRPLLLLSFLCCLSVGSPDVEPEVVSVVLLGATGDLAKKYLWQAIFALYVNNRSPRVAFQVIAAARDNEASGRPKVEKYIKEKTNCKQDIQEDKQKECESALTEFAKLWEYRQLKTDDDYKALNTRIIAQVGDRVEAGRLFYLSVPPFAYSLFLSSSPSFSILPLPFASATWACVAALTCRRPCEPPQLSETSHMYTQSYGGSYSVPSIRRGYQETLRSPA